jgi:hypothetical protein
MAEQSPNEKMIGSAQGDAVVQAQKNAAGTYKDRSQWGTLTTPSLPKDTVHPFRVQG